MAEVWTYKSKQFVVLILVLAAVGAYAEGPDDSDYDPEHHDVFLHSWDATSSGLRFKDQDNVTPISYDVNVKIEGDSFDPMKAFSGTANILVKLGAMHDHSAGKYIANAIIAHGYNNIGLKKASDRVVGKFINGPNPRHWIVGSVNLLQIKNAKIRIAKTVDELENKLGEIVFADRVFYSERKFALGLAEAMKADSYGLLSIKFKSEYWPSQSSSGSSELQQEVAKALISDQFDLFPRVDNLDEPLDVKLSLTWNPSKVDITSNMQGETVESEEGEGLRKIQYKLTTDSISKQEIVVRSKHQA